MKQKAFTLIELLATIVILGVIMVITVPTITGIIESSTKKAFFTDAQMVLEAIEYKKIEDKTFNPTTVNETNVESLLKIPDDNYQSVTVTIENNKTTIVIIGQNKWDGLVAYGTLKNITVENEEDYVVDETPPVITVIGDSIVSINIGSEYSDAGATATDNVDGDLTANIVITNNVNTAVAGTYTVIYTVMDSSYNNAVPKVRIVNVIDHAPVLTLLGNSLVTINLGDTYVDAGATANDAEDGDITGDIVVTSTVNPNVAGTYIVLYEVTDSSGNEADTITRTVVVEGPAYGTSENPAESCKQILDEGDSIGDGSYWLSPGGYTPFQAYCDMTTYDGGWTRVYNNQTESFATISGGLGEVSTTEVMGKFLGETAWGRANTSGAAKNIIYATDWCGSVWGSCNVNNQGAFIFYWTSLSNGAHKYLWIGAANTFGTGEVWQGYVCDCGGCGTYYWRQNGNCSYLYNSSNYEIYVR